MEVSLRLLFCLGLFVLSAQASSQPGDVKTFGFDPFAHICPRALITLANSLSDTGNYLILFPDAPSGQPPYGITWPGYPTGRFSNGRLTVDYVSLKLGLGYPVPFFSANDTGSIPDFRTSINFAVAGSTAQNTSVLQPFYLLVQVDEVIAVFNSAVSGDAPYPVPPPEAFSKALYYIEIGGNDISFALLAGTPLDIIANAIGPAIASNIAQAIQTLYDQVGARLFLVWNIPPLGCATFVITQFSNYAGAGQPDPAGCLPGINAVVQQVDADIAAALNELRQTLPDANIILVDVYPLIYDITANPQNYGLTEPLRACCGSPTGPLNYDPAIPCGPDPSVTPVCPNPWQYVNWDGIHFTQAVYQIIATNILGGAILEPPVSFIPCIKGP